MTANGSKKGHNLFRGLYESTIKGALFVKFIEATSCDLPIRKKHSNEQLKYLRKSHERPFLKKRNNQLVETVILGPTIYQSITELNKFCSTPFFNHSHRKIICHLNLVP